MKTSKMLKKWFAENEGKDCLVSCEFSERFKKWEVKEMSCEKLPTQISLVKNRNKIFILYIL